MSYLQRRQSDDGMMAAIKNVSPSHLMDQNLREMVGLDPVTGHQ